MTDLFRIRENPDHGEIHGYGTACFAKRGTPVPTAELRSFASSLMKAVASGCLALGAKDIGHVKAYIEHDNGFLMADTVGDPGDVTIEGRDGKAAMSFRIVLNSVVLGLSREAVGRATDDALKHVADEFGLHLEKDNSHNHPTGTER